MLLLLLLLLLLLPLPRIAAVRRSLPLVVVLALGAFLLPLLPLVLVLVRRSLLPLGPTFALARATDGGGCGSGDTAAFAFRSNPSRHLAETCRTGFDTTAANAPILGSIDFTPPQASHSRTNRCLTQPNSYAHHVSESVPPPSSPGSFFSIIKQRAMASSSSSATTRDDEAPAVPAAAAPAPPPRADNSEALLKDPTGFWDQIWKSEVCACAWMAV